jgi:hypothetical protein
MEHLTDYIKKSNSRLFETVGGFEGWLLTEGRMKLKIKNY